MGSAGRMHVPPEGAATAPRSAILRLPGLGGLRFLHATRDDRERPVPARPPHAHDLWHCVAYTAGIGSCVVDAAVVAVRAPFLVLISPGQQHNFSRQAGDSTVYSEVTFAAERPGSVPDWSRLLGLWTGQDCPLPACGACAPECAADVAAVAGRMVAAISDGHLQLPVLLQGLLAELLFTVFRHRIADAERAQPRDPVELARAFIERHAEDPIDLPAVARAAGLSAKHLGRAFAARFGDPPMRFRRRVLMRRAGLLLRTSDQPVERIAERLGFNDWRYFSRAFRAEHGLPPGRFRRGR